MVLSAGVVHRWNVCRRTLLDRLVGNPRRDQPRPDLDQHQGSNDDEDGSDPRRPGRTRGSTAADDYAAGAGR